MTENLSGNLHNTLREQLGGTYGVSVEPRFPNRPAGEVQVAINFGCDPPRADSLVRTAFQLIDQFKTVGPGDGQVADTRKALERDLEANSQRNEYLLERVLFKYTHHENVSDVFNMKPYYDQLTATMLRDAARLYLNTNRYVEVVLKPETK
jgi:zinc protease